MAPQLSTEAELDVLRNIHRIATDLTHLLKKSSNSLKSSTTLKPPIPPLDLPFPHDILSPVYAISPTKLREQLISCFTSRIAELRSQYVLAFQRACSATLPLQGKVEADLNAIRQTYEAFYRRQCFPIIKAQVASVVAEVSKRHCNGLRDKRPSFRAEFTPLLERYFECNAYPSSSHRSVLASKSMMSPRQIEVWFQNHRNRAKKDGKALNRNNSDVPLRLCLERAASGTTTTTEMSDLSSDESGDEVSDLDQPTTSPFRNCISDKRPQHAFPTPYPPMGIEDPFQCNGKYLVPTPVWRRRPAPKVLADKHRSIDMDELTFAFASKLHFRDQSVKGEKSKKRRPPCGPWFTSTTTRPFPAPLPSLIRTPYTSSSSACPRAPRSPQLPKFGSLFHELASLSKRPSKILSTSSRFVPSLSNSRTPSLTSLSSFQSRSSSSSSFSPILPDESEDFTSNEPHVSQSDLQIFSNFLDQADLSRTPGYTTDSPAFDYLHNTQFPSAYDHCNIFNAPLGQLLVSS